MKRDYLIRNINAGDLVEFFLVSAIGSLLLVRFFLYITHYPQLGGHGIHIAHMLWGGLFMLAALILLLSFLSNTLIRIAAGIGGMGFGLFIDELGKFITRDNNYFFQPSIALIYSIFVLLFLLLRAIERDQELTKKEYLMNALQMMEEAVLQDMDLEEKKQVAILLRKSDQRDPLVIHLKAALELIDLAPPPNPTLISTTRIYFRKIYQKLIKSSEFKRLLILFFVTKSVFTVIIIPIIFVFFLFSSTSFHVIISQLTFTQWLQLFSSTLSAIFVVLGALRIRSSRYDAYILFKRSILVSIFLTQIFAFYREQLTAITGVIVNILILFILQYMIDQEKLLRKEEK